MGTIWCKEAKDTPKIFVASVQVTGVMADEGEIISKMLMCAPVSQSQAVYVKLHQGS